jgi:hypothetical protein
LRVAPLMRMRSDSGAILVVVAVGLLVLMAFSGFVIDKGLMMVTRGQAQNAADAGALAGAVALAFDGDTREDDGPAKTAAYAFAISNYVAGTAPPVIDPTSGDATDVKFYTDNPGDFPAVCIDNNCIRVDVHRTQAAGRIPLPVFFTQLIGVTDQGVRATATARVSAANATDCLRPFGVPDLWFEENTPPTPAEFNAYVTASGGTRGAPVTPPDVYQAPTTTTTGSGYNVAAHYGREFVLKSGPQNANAQQPGWFQPIDIPIIGGGPTAGGERFRTNIERCNGVPVPIGTRLPTETGAMVGPAAQGIRELIAQDPYADWDTSEQAVVDSCVQATPSCGAFSPRTITLALYDTEDFQRRSTQNDWSGCPTGGSCVKIVNFLGFFVDRMQGNDVIGYLVRAPGLLVTGAPAVGPASAFLTQISLIR